MRVPRWIAPVLAAAVLLTGCTGNGQKNSANPATSTIAADAAPTTDPTPESVETLDEQPTDEPTADATTTTPAPTRTRSKDPNLPIIVPRNTVALTCIKPASLPKLAATNGNDYPKIVFNAMCGSEPHKKSGLYRFGQVGVGEGVECGTEYVIDGNEPVGVAWWCPQHKLLISSPAAVIADYSSDKWKLLRELAVAYAMAYTSLELHTTDLDSVACVIGRTIRNLRTKNLLSSGNAKALVGNFTTLLKEANHNKLSLNLSDGYNGKRC